MNKLICDYESEEEEEEEIKDEISEESEEPIESRKRQIESLFDLKTEYLSKSQSTVVHDESTFLRYDKETLLPNRKKERREEEKNNEDYVGLRNEKIIEIKQKDLLENNNAENKEFLNDVIVGQSTIASLTNEYFKGRHNSVMQLAKNAKDLESGLQKKYSDMRKARKESRFKYGF
jgi:hypothetical protein